MKLDCMQEAIAVTTEIQEELFQEMGVGKFVIGDTVDFYLCWILFKFDCCFRSNQLCAVIDCIIYFSILEKHLSLCKEYALSTLVLVALFFQGWFDCNISCENFYLLAQLR